MIEPGSSPRRRTVRETFWRSQLRRTAILLSIWAVVAFGLSILGADLLNRFVIGGVPLGFWMAQQGSIFIFILLILVYTILSDRADRRQGLREDLPPPSTQEPF